VRRDSGGTNRALRGETGIVYTVEALPINLETIETELLSTREMTQGPDRVWPRNV
jgi:hypothetical protein